MTQRCGRERESINECESVWEFPGGGGGGRGGATAQRMCDDLPLILVGQAGVIDPGE